MKNYKITVISKGFPCISEFSIENIKFRLYSNNLYYLFFLNPDCIKSITKNNNIVTILLDSNHDLVRCCCHNYLTIDLFTKEIVYNKISYSKYDIIELATSDKIIISNIENNENSSISINYYDLYDIKINIM